MIWNTPDLVGAYNADAGWRQYSRGESAHRPRAYLDVMGRRPRRETSFWSGHVVAGFPDGTRPPSAPRTTTTTRRPARPTTTTTIGRDDDHDVPTDDLNLVDNVDDTLSDDDHHVATRQRRARLTHSKTRNATLRRRVSCKVGGADELLPVERATRARRVEGVHTSRYVARAGAVIAGAAAVLMMTAAPVGAITTPKSSSSVVSLGKLGRGEATATMRGSSAGPRPMIFGPPPAPVPGSGAG